MVSDVKQETSKTKQKARMLYKLIISYVTVPPSSRIHVDTYARFIILNEISF